LQLFFSFNLYSAEPSAFGAGNLDNPQPYGLSASEKTVLQNKNKIHDVVVKSKNQSYKIDSLSERIDGLQSIVESLTKGSHQNKVDLQKLDKKNLQELKNSSEYEKRLNKITQKNSDNIKKTNLVLEQLNELVKKN
jgi:TolA-binding protein